MTQTHKEQDMTSTDFNIYERAIKQGLVIDHRESDLYIKGTPESRVLVEAYTEATGFRVSAFRSASDNHAVWYEIHGGYSPWWNKSGYKSKV